MTVLLVLITFLLFALLDWILSRGKMPVPAPSRAFVTPALEPDYVDGFLTPRALRYHPGHTWFVRERHHVARVGVDQFAAALAGRIERVELPKPGQWVRQGQKAWAMFRNGERTEMVSPVEGEVMEINTELTTDPALLRREPYGLGWLMTVHVPDEESMLRNLIPTNLVREWMHEAVSRLYARQPQLAGPAAAEAGPPVEDLSAALPEVSWKALAGEFFLT